MDLRKESKVVQITGFVYVQGTDYWRLPQYSRQSELKTLGKQLRFWKKTLGESSRDRDNTPPKVLFFWPGSRAENEASDAAAFLLEWDRSFSVCRTGCTWTDSRLHDLLAQMLKPGQKPLEIELQKLMTESRPKRLRETPAGKLFEKRLKQDYKSERDEGRKKSKKIRLDLWKNCQYPKTCADNCIYCGTQLGGQRA